MLDEVLRKCLLYVCSLSNNIIRITDSQNKNIVLIEI